MLSLRPPELLPNINIVVIIIVIVIVFSSVTVFAGILFVHQPGGGGKANTNPNLMHQLFKSLILSIMNNYEYEY